MSRIWYCVSVYLKLFQTASGVSSKVMDDYCWIHSTFHIRSEFQGNVGCVLDTVLAGQSSLAMAAAETPDTAFYQWVPFTLVFQVCKMFPSAIVNLSNTLINNTLSHRSFLHIFLRERVWYYLYSKLIRNTKKCQREHQRKENQ